MRNETINGLPQAQISRAIGLSRILLIVGLVFLHYGSFPNSGVHPSRGLDVNAHPFATWANSAVLFFFYSSVPLLSMISGWLFFSFPPADARAALGKRIRRRFASLYLPLVFWNAAYLAAMVGMFALRPEAANFGKLNIDFSSAGAMDYVNAVFGVTQSPIGFQFWFVRDLFVTVLISPLLWLVLRYAPWLGAAAMGAAWLGELNTGIFLRIDVPLFFYLGALVRRKRLSVTVPLPAAIVLAALYAALAGLRALAPYAVPAGGDIPLWLYMATCAMRVVGVIGCWGMIYRLAETRWGSAASKYGGLAFFLHSAHWPLLSVMKSALWRFIPAESDAWMFAHYAVSVILTVAVCLAAAMTLARFVPRIFALMNGGRLLEQVPPGGARTSAVL